MRYVWKLFFFYFVLLFIEIGIKNIDVFGNVVEE